MRVIFYQNMFLVVNMYISLFGVIDLRVNWVFFTIRALYPQAGAKFVLTEKLIYLESYKICSKLTLVFFIKKIREFLYGLCCVALPDIKFKDLNNKVCIKVVAEGVHDVII